MKKQRVERFLSSLFGHHIHHEHSQVLEGKKDIDRKIEKILELIGAQENSGNLEGESEIVPFIEEFYESYKILYGKYHHLLEKIKEDPDKELNGDLSDKDSSSDSDSSSSESEKSNHGKKSSKHNGKEHGKQKVSMEEYHELQGQLEIWKNRSQGLEIQAASLLSRLNENERLLVETRKFFLALEQEPQNIKQSSEALEVEDEKLMLQLDSSSSQQIDMNQELTVVSKEYDSLISEMALAQASINDVKTERDSLNNLIKKLLNENTTLKEEMKAARNQIEDLNQKLVTASEEKDRFDSEHSSVLSMINKAEKTIDELRLEANLNLTLANEKALEISNLHSTIKELNFKLEMGSQQVAGLNQHLATLKESNDTLNTEVQLTNIQLQEFQGTVDKLKTDCNLLKDSELKLVGINEQLMQEKRTKDEEFDALSFKHSEAMDNIKLAEEHIKKLVFDLSHANGENSKIFESHEDLKQDLQASALKVSELENKLEVVLSEKNAVSGEYEVLTSERSVILNRLNDTSKMVEELTAERDLLKYELDKLQQDITTVREELRIEAGKVTDLQGQLAYSDEENAKVLSKLIDVEKWSEDLRSERESFSEMTKQLQNECMVLKEEMKVASDRIEDLNKKLVTANEEKDRLDSERSSVLSMIEGAEKTIDDLKLEANLNLTLANDKELEISDLRSSIKQLNFKLEMGNQQVTDLHQQLAILKEENFSVNSEVHEAKLQLQAFQTTIDKLKKDCEFLKDNELNLVGINEELMQEKRMKHEEFDALSFKHGKVVDKIKLAEEHIEKLLLDLNHVNREKSELSKSHEGLKEDFQASAIKISELENKLEVTLAEKHALSGEFEVLASERSVTMNRLNDTFKIVEELTTERDLFKTELDKLRQDITAVKEELRIEVEKVTDLHGQLAYSDEEKTKALSKLRDVEKCSEDLRSERDFLNDLIKQLENESIVLKEEMKVASDQIEDLNKKLVIVHEEKDRLDLEHSSVLSMIDRAEKTIEDLKLEADLNLKVANEKDLEISDLHSTIEQVNLKLEMGNQQVADLTQQLATMKEKNSSLNSEVHMGNIQLLEFQATIKKLKTECELLRDSELKLVGINEELMQEKRIRNEEFDALSSRHNKVVDNIKLAEEHIDKLQLDLSHVNGEKSELFNSYEGLKQDLQTSALQVSELESKLELILAEKHVLNGEYEVLASERSVTMDSLKDTIKVVEEVTTQRDLFRDEVDQMQQDITAIREELRIEAEKVTELHDQLAHSDEEKTKVSSELIDVKKWYEDLGSERDSLNNVIKQLQNENMVLKEEMEATSYQIEDLNKKLVIACEEKDRLNAENSSVMLMINKAEITIHNLKLEANSNLTLANEKALQISDLHSTIEQLNLESERGRQQVTDLSQQLATLKEENCKLNSEVHMANMQLKEFNTTIVELKSVCESLKDSELKLLCINEELTREKSIKNEEFTVLSLKHSEVVDKIKLAEEHIEKLLSDLNHVNEEKSALSQIHEGLKQELQVSAVKMSELESKLEVVLAEKHTLSEEYEALTSEKSVTMNKLNDTGKMVEELIVERDLFKDEVNTLQQDIAAAREELRIEVEKVTDLHSQLACSDEEKAKVLSKLFDIEKWSEDLRSEKELSDCKLVRLQDDVASLKQELEQTVNQLFDLQILLTSISEEKEMIASKLSETKKENEELKNEKQMLNNQILKYQEDAATLVQNLELEERTISDLHQKLACLTQEKDALSLDNAAMVKNIEDTEKIIISLKNDIDINGNIISDKQEENAQLLAQNEGLKLEIEAASQHRNDLSHELATAKEDRSSLRLGIATVESKMQDTEKAIEQLRSDYNFLKNEELKLLKTVKDLNKNLNAKDEEIDSLSSKISEFIEENNLANEHIQTLLMETQKLGVENSNLKTDLEMLKVDFNSAGCKLSEQEKLFKIIQKEKYEESQKNAAHVERIELAEKLIQDLKNETEQLRYLNSESKVKVTDLTKLVSDKEKEKDLLVAENLVLLNELQKAEDLIKSTEMEIEKLEKEVSRFQQVESYLLEKNSSLQRSLNEKENELLSRQNELDNVKKETSSQITTLMTQANDLQLEVDILHNQKCEMEEQRKNLISELSDNKVLMDNVKSELIEKLSTRESLLNEQTDRFEELKESHMLLESRLQETCLELETAQAMLKELDSKSEIISRLEALGQQLKIEKEQLEEKNKELLDSFQMTDEEKTNAEKENIRLQGQVDTLEVQLRLSNRKLKITETEQKEKVTSYKRRIEELQENQKKLELEVTTLHEKKQLFETVFVNIKDTAEKNLANLGLSSQSLVSLIMEKCNKFQARVSNSCLELQKIKEKLEDTISKMQELDQERSELKVRVKYEECIASMLKEQAESLHSKLIEKTKEEERLTGVVKKYETEVTELETMLKVKEEAASYKDEEKREAIRQLCILIEYHRENYNHLYQIISSKFRRASS